MRVKIIDITLDKKTYLYGIDSNINLLFKLESNSNKNQNIKEVYIYYGFNIICDGKKHTIISKKISLEKNVILEKDGNKKYNISIPINISNSKGDSIEIENFLYIKLSSPNLKEKIKPKILFLVKKYEKYKIYNLENYIGLDNYILSDDFDNESESNIEKNISKYSNIKNNYNQSKGHNKIALKTEFKGLFSSIYNIIDLLPKDYIDIDVLNNIKKKSKLFKLSYFLLNSRKYGLIYKYIFILPTIFIIPFFLLPKNYIIGFSFSISLLGFLLFIGFSKIIEKNYKKILYNNLFNIKLFSSEIISNNINNKFKTGSLNINDIFERFDVNINIPIDYMFSIKLDSYIQSYSGNGKNIVHETNKVYGVELFYDQGKQIFNINNIKLVKNNYNKLYNILLPTFNKGILNGFNKIYYKISIIFESSYLPKYQKELKINLNKNLFHPRDLNKYNKLYYFFILFISFPLFSGLLYLIYVTKFE